MSLPCPVSRYKNGNWECFADNVSREVPLRLHWSYPALSLSGSAALWTWPGPDEAALQELALGHVLTDLLPVTTQDPTSSRTPSGAVAGMLESGYTVTLSHCPSSPCLLASAAPPLAPDLILSQMQSFITASGKWDGTGCFHRAGVYLPSPSFQTLFAVEDIGRHNCLDRLAGHAAATGLSLHGCTLFVTARITASLYAKARRIGFTEIVSRSAVTLHSVACAQEEGVRLIGFCRPNEERFTVFA